MNKHILILVLFVCVFFCNAQSPNLNSKNLFSKEQDTVNESLIIKSLKNGYVPLKYFDLDVKYLLKFNQFEGVRTGLGGVTTEKFSKRFKILGYGAYGFADKRYKFKVGTAFKLNRKDNNWVTLAYTDDIQETGSSTFLTDKRFFNLFQPRQLNVDLFHRYIKKSINLSQQFYDKFNTEIELASSNINPTYNYFYRTQGKDFNTFSLATAKLSIQWSPFSQFQFINDTLVETKNGFPKFTIQATQSFESLLGSDFNFTKLDFRVIHYIKHRNNARTEATIVAGIAEGDIPITHLYHAYPNNINKETILQRFSIAGLNSFETMFFNEFFSDKFSTLQLKHTFAPLNISTKFKPEFALISRYAVGNMRSKDKHIGINFDTLRHVYSESGFELNKLFYGFGLSFAYRYGAYYLPKFEDNIAFKFTFNLKL